MNIEDSNVMKTVFQEFVNPLNSCCMNKVMDMSKENVVNAFISSGKSFQDWLRIRQFRITGSRVYAIYTYSFNKNPDWKKKSLNYFYPKSFTNKFVEHGKKSEKMAIHEYELSTKSKVEICGIVISKLNAWMSYSPDGIIIKDGKPVTLIEVKCPYEGRTNNISSIIKNLKFINVNDNNTLNFNKKHSYYGQIQMGMAILNVFFTHFVIFASFDKSILNMFYK